MYLYVYITFIYKYRYTNKAVYFIFQEKPTISQVSPKVTKRTLPPKPEPFASSTHFFLFKRYFSLTAHSIRNAITILQVEKLFANGIGKGNSKTSGKVKS